MVLKLSNRKRDYRFIDKDPICDVLRTIISDDGRMPTAIADEARLFHQTVLNILFGKTQKPRSTTVNAIAHACGYRMVLMKEGKPAIVVTPYEKQLLLAAKQEK